MFQAHTPDDGSIFLPFSVYSDRSHSSFPFFVFLFFFFVFFYFIFYIFLFIFFIALLYSVFLSLSFPRLSTAAYPSMHKSRQKEKKSWVPADGQNGRQVQRKQTGPCANFQEITMESMPVLLEEGCPNRLTPRRLLNLLTIISESCPNTLTHHVRKKRNDYIHLFLQETKWSCIQGIRKLRGVGWKIDNENLVTCKPLCPFIIVCRV